MRYFLPDDQSEALFARFDNVRFRIAEAAKTSDRSPADVTLIAVSKVHPPEALATLACYWGQDGIPIFGENYVQEALEKQHAVAALAPDIQPAWHFIGHVQSRKARDVVRRFLCVETVDSLKLARNLQKAWREMAAVRHIPRQAVLMQINIGREPQKSGVLPEDAARLALAVREMPELDMQGIMCIPPLTVFEGKNADASRPYFAAMRELRDALARETGLLLKELSMGMSHDCEVAISEGATMVRIGTDIFGPRPLRPSTDASS